MGRDGSRQRKPRNYYGSKTCATAAYLNEACENTAFLSLPREREKKEKKKEKKKKKKSGEEKREKENYRDRGKGNGQIIISGPG